MSRQDRIAAIEAAAKERILVLDGAMGTMLQRHRLGEQSPRDERERLQRDLVEPLGVVDK